MKFETILSHCSEVVEITRKSHIPTDELLGSYFRQKKYIGSSERKIISEIVFMHLRFLGFSQYVFDKLKKEFNDKNSNTNSLGLLITLFINIELYTKNIFNIAKSIEKLYSTENGILYMLNFINDQIPNFFNLLKSIISEINILHKFILKQEINNSLENKSLIEQVSIRYSIPEFILNSWLKYYPKQGINPFELAESLLFPTELTIRVNKIGFTRSKIIDLLRDAKIEANETPYSPFGIKIPERVNLLQLDIYKRGIIDIQDEGSQLVCLACNPKPNDKILDACAGAGGKSLFLAFLQNDKGKIIANDVVLPKLIELNRRAKRAGFSSITTHHLSGKNLKRASLLRPDFFDIVLVDAPCSGIGTARRSPIHKWWLTPNKLRRFAKKQFDLLSFYSQFVRPKGYLIYSTCSLMPEENIEVVESFQKANPNFIPVPLLQSFQKFGIELPMLKKDSYTITLLPSIHKTDGFFIAKLQRAT